MHTAHGIVLLLLLATVALSQTVQQYVDKLPPELQVSDPEPRKLWIEALSFAKDGKYIAAEGSLDQAIAICTQKGYQADCAVLRSVSAQWHLLQGKVETAEKLYRAAYDGAVKSGNQIFQADLLITECFRYRINNDVEKAKAQLVQAIEIAQRSRSRLLLARAHGEHASVLLWAGEAKAAEDAIDRAIAIDKANDYDPALHYLYRAQILTAEKRASEAYQVLEQARTLAKAGEDNYVLAFVTIELSKLTAAKGDVAHALNLLTDCESGKWKSPGGSIEEIPGLQRIAELPFVKLVLLVARAEIYRGANRVQEAFEVYLKTYGLAEAAGLEVLHAGSALELARMALLANRPEDSEQFSRIAAQEFGNLGINNQERDARLVLSDSLMRLQKYRAAIEQLSFLSKRAQSEDDLLLLFTVQSEIGRAYFLSKDSEQALQYWGQADVLVPYLLASAKLDKKALRDPLIGHFRSMLGVYLQQGRVGEALGTWAKGVTTMEEVDDESNWATFLKEFGEAIEKTQARTFAEKAYNEKNWLAALLLNQVIDTYDARQGAGFHGQRTMSGLAFERLLDIPFKMTTDAAGARMLEANLEEMGFVSPISRRAGYDALVRFYLRTSNPVKAYDYAKGLLFFLNFDRTTILEVDVEEACLVAFAAFENGDTDAARKHSETCSSSAARLSQPSQRLTSLAQQIQARVFSLQDPQKAQDLLKSILAQSPEDVGSQLALANTYSSQNRLQDSFTIWDKLIIKFRNEQNIAALADLNLTVAQTLILHYSPRHTSRDPLQYLIAAEEGYVQLRNERGSFEVALAEAEYWMKTGKKKDALRSTEKANRLATSFRAPLFTARATAKRAEVFSAFGDHKSALTERRIAIRLYEANGTDKTEWVSLLIDQGSDFKAIGNIAEAIDSFQSAIRMSDETRSGFDRRWARQSLASLYSDRGEYLLAVRFLREALVIADGASDVLGAAWCSLSLGWAYFSIGEWAEAEKAGESALRMARSLSNPELEFHTISLLMNVFGDRRSSFLDVNRALSLYKNAEQIATTNPDLDLGVLSETATEVYWRAGDFDSAIKQAELSSERAKREHDNYSLAHSLMALSESLTKKGDLALAEQRLSQADGVIRSFKDDAYTVGRWYYTKAQLLRAQGKHKEAAEAYERVLTYLEQLRSRIRDSELLRKAADTYSFVYDELVDTYFAVSKNERDQGLPARRALEYAESEKAMQFLKAWGPLFARQLSTELPLALREREQSLQFTKDEASNLAKRAEEGGNLQEIERSRTRERTSNADLEQFANSLRLSYPAYASVKYPQIARLDQIHREPGESVVVFRVAADHSYVWTLSDAGISFERIDRPRQWFNEAIESIRDTFNRAQPAQLDQARIGRVFEILFSTSESRLRLLNSKSITVIPDGVLFLLPLEMFTLPSKPGMFPLMGKAIRYFPSLATYAISHNFVQTKSWQKELIAFGNPIFDKQQIGTNAASRGQQELVTRGLLLEPLPGTQKELDEVRSLFPAGTALTFVGQDANKQRVMQTDLSGFRFLHFATHGLLPTDSNLVEPALAFSLRTADDRDIFLQMSEVLQLQLNAEMVVLSACNTGSGRIDHTEGVQNLGRAFMLAGARSTVISLWQVADESTALLMREFYHGILMGKKKSEALADARTAIFSSGFTHPFYWSPFVLMGD